MRCLALPRLLLLLLLLKRRLLLLLLLCLLWLLRLASLLHWLRLLLWLLFLLLRSRGRGRQPVCRRLSCRRQQAVLMPLGRRRLLQASILCPSERQLLMCCARLGRFCRRPCCRLLLLLLLATAACLLLRSGWLLLLLLLLLLCMLPFLLCLLLLCLLAAPLRLLLLPRLPLPLRCLGPQLSVSLPLQAAHVRCRCRQDSLVAGIGQVHRLPRGKAGRVNLVLHGAGRCDHRLQARPAAFERGIEEAGWVCRNEPEGAANAVQPELSLQ